MFDYQFTRRYGQARTFYFTLRQSSATNALPPEMTTGLTHAAGDTQISKDGGAFANTTNAFAALGFGIYSIALTVTEMQASDIVVSIKDQTAPAAWIGVMIHVETFIEARRIDISNDNGDAISAVSTGANGKGLNLAGNGTGHGLHATGGATGDGFRGTGGATSGAGIIGIAATAGNGITATGAGSGSGISATGGTTGHGILGTGGATSGSGIRGAAQAGNGSGLEGIGALLGSGLRLQAGATGNGITALGGATSGAGASFQGSTNGYGLQLVANGANNAGLRCEGGSHGAHFIAGPSTSHGIFAEAGTGGGACHGIHAVGKTTGAGIHAIAGTTGHGIFSEGGATSGDGIRSLATAGNGHGLNLFGQGTGSGLLSTGGATGLGGQFIGGGTSGAGLRAAAQAGNSSGFRIEGRGNSDTNAALMVDSVDGTAPAARFIKTVAGGEFNLVSSGGKGIYALGATGQIAAHFEADTTAEAAFKCNGGVYGIRALASAVSGAGFSAKGNGTSPGVWIEGGAGGGVGLKVEGGLAGGAAATFVAQAGSNPGVSMTGFGSQPGLSLTGGATGAGLLATGGVTSGSGIVAQAQSGTSHGFRGIGATTGAGMSLVGGATGQGLRATGGATSGEGIRADAQAGNSDGMIAVGQGTGHGLEGSPDIFPVASWTELEGAEPTIPPPNNATMKQILQYLKRHLLNKGIQTDTTRTIHRDDSVTVLYTQPVSVAGTTQTRNKAS